MGQHINESAVEAVGVIVAQKATQAGAVAGVLGWLSQINWIGLSGVVIAVIGLVVNFYFQHRRDLREQAESIARIQALADKCEVQARGQ